VEKIDMPRVDTRKNMTSIWKSSDLRLKKLLVI
jgi:hypothetical protein